MNLSVGIEEFKNYVARNSTLLEATFRNRFLSEGFSRFIDSFNEIVDKLLLSDIRNILTQTWRSS